MWAVRVLSNKTSEQPSSRSRDEPDYAALAKRIDELVQRLTIAPIADRFLRRREVLPLSGFGSWSTVKNKIKEGAFPAPIKISEGRDAWSEREIIAWQQAKIANRNATLTERMNQPDETGPKPLASLRGRQNE
jgi:predicted DNA-binding transcriptional regulator AlpA